jgi:hypothetical protein
VSYLSAATHAAIIANPASIETYYEQARPTFKTNLGNVDLNSDIPNGLLAVAFAAIAAWDLKPYGNNPVGKDLQSLLNAATLACNDYVLLTWYLCGFMPEAVGVNIVALGWNGGAVGNHAQMLAADPATGISLLLDPTVGIVARGCTYNSLLRGVGVPGSQRMASFAAYNSYVGSTGAFTDEVFNAINGGQYKPSDALYYVDQLSIYAALPPEANWLTPQGAALTG